MISAIISTYNREKFLPDLFKSIQNQSLDSNQFEIIIVDNNSPGNTKELSMNLKKNSSFSVQYFLENESILLFVLNQNK